MKEPNALPYENRMGDIFYLQQGKTSTGKPKYYAGKKLTGAPMDALPDGYEFYERPDNAQVVLRKVKPSCITEFERKQCEEIVGRVSGLTHFIVEIDGDALVVHTPSVTRADAESLFETIARPFSLGLPSAKAGMLREIFLKRSQYVKMLRFELLNPDTRIFGAARWCFRGSIDDWITLLGRGSLAHIVEAYAKHLDRESFFELF
jgi:hypothetical protein